MAKAKTTEVKPEPAADQAQMFEGPAVASLTDSDVLASLSAWARGFGTDRETLRRALLEHGVEPVAERGGHKLYALRPVYQAWTAGAAEDPDKLKPFQRKAWYQGTREKVAWLREMGRLCDVSDVERTISRALQILVRYLETSVDVLERSAGLTPEQAARLEAHLDKMREEMYQAITEDDEDEEAPVPQTAVLAGEVTETTLHTEHVTPADEPVRERSSSSSAVDDGVAFLRRELAGGAQPTAELIARAKAEGLSEATLRRAKAQMGTELVAKRKGKGWVWQLAQSA